MSHNDAPESKKIKSTQEEDTKRDNIIDDGRSMADSRGKTGQQHIAISVYI